MNLYYSDFCRLQIFYNADHSEERSALFKLEDVYISRLVSTMCGVTYLHVNNMYAVFPNEIDSSIAIGYHSFLQSEK